MKKLFAYVSLAAFALVGAACSSDGDAAPDPTPAPNPVLTVGTCDEQPAEGGSVTVSYSVENPVEGGGEMRPSNPLKAGRTTSKSTRTALPSYSTETMRSPAPILALRPSRSATPEPRT